MIDIKDKKYLALYGVTDRWWVKQKLEKAGVPVTDDALREGLLEDTKAALDGGMTYVQMREKGDPMTEDELLTEALALKKLCEEYGVSINALGRWIKQYSTVETDDGEVLTALQVKELQKRMAQLEEENLILKKAIAIFTPHSNND